METYEIGEVVTWEISDTVKCVGIVYNDLGGETVDVLCVDINSKKAKVHVDVVRGILSKYEK